jgi:hypothetical protein
MIDPVETFRELSEGNFVKFTMKYGFMFCAVDPETGKGTGLSIEFHKATKHSYGFCMLLEGIKCPEIISQKFYK